ncbi:MAG TPA: UbiD family decarboxylase [Planctomycetota bacterium]|nr:UbiD family decarboxylase [Planctomycetota bacterium]
MSASFPDLRAFLDDLRRAGELVEVEAEVDPELEAAEVHRRVIAAGGPALLFRRVKGCDFPLATNLFGTAARVERAFGRRPRELIERVARLPHELLPPSLGGLWAHRDLFASLARVGLGRRGAGPVTEVVDTPPRLTRLPALKTWPRDGGRFVTLPLVLTEPPGGGPTNLGMYRIQLFDDARTGLHMQIGKGGGFHLAAAEARGESLPVVVHVGGPPALMLSAIAPLPENVPELLLASLVLGKRLPLAKNPVGPLPLVADAEFALVGEVRPGARHPEGPFGDHYGYYSETHDYPLLEVKALCRRRDAIFPATVVGKPRQEDFFLGDFLQELLSPLFPLVMPAVKSLWSYGETGYHALAGAVVAQRYKREAMASAFRILGEGQLSLTKFLIATDGAIDLRDFKGLLEHVLARADFRTDLFLFANLAMDSLDYAGPRIDEGSKGVLLGLGEPRRALPTSFAGGELRGVRDVRVFCPGCVVLTVDGHAADRDAAKRLAREPALADWPLVVLSDDAERATRSTSNFLWTTFTRFDPAADLTGRAVELVHNHAAFTPPVVLDARMKAGYPEELFCDGDTADLVTRRWGEYFPAGGVEMGDSDRAHLD